MEVQTELSSLSPSNPKFIKPNKGWLNILKILLPYFIVVGTFQFIGGTIVGVNFLQEEIEMTEYQQFVVSIFDMVATFLLLLVFMHLVDKERFVDLGFQIKGKSKDIYWGLFLSLIIMVSGFLIMLSIGEIEYVSTELQIKELLYSLGLFTIVAFVEETLFRGYILGNLLHSMNKYYALLISSLIFAIAHTGNPNMSWFSFLDLFLAGVVLGISYIYTKNLWFPIALHFGWNFFQTHLGFNVSGMDTYSVVNINIVEGNLLNGGEFGFEGSILSVAFELIVLTAIFIYFKRKPQEVSG